jgi:Leucine-rich repeat (LRR) protein
MEQPNKILEEIKKSDISEEIFKGITEIVKKYETVLNPNSLYSIIIQMFNTEEYFKDKSYDCEFGIISGGSATLINNIDNLEIFPNLYSIMFGKNTITDWTPLLKLKNLKELDLSNNSNTNRSFIRTEKFRRNNNNNSTW